MQRRRSLLSTILKRRVSREVLRLCCRVFQFLTKSMASDMAEKAEGNVEIFQQFESFDFDSNASFQEGWQSISQRLGDDANRETFIKAKLFFFSRHVTPINLDDYLVWKSCEQYDEEYRNGKSTALQATAATNSDPIVNHANQLNQRVVQSESECSFVRNTRVVFTTASSPEARLEKNISDQSSKVASNASGSELTKDDTWTKMIATKPSGIPNRIFNSSVECDSEEGFNDSSVVQADSSSSKNSSTIEEIQPSLSLAELAELIKNQQPIPGLLKLDVQPTNSSPTPTALARKPKPWQTSIKETQTSILDTS
ncbi:hypothetical protein EGW08_017157 [Elysia chlorotica]|uniref:Uncharacterized protein n=1 Tax=Elysia chlorotica TaxID=188477 RepID=A0A433T0L1_ELYCH|nr:hypothetical protein EGW08_017157 [Elysia chlorotica]